MVDAVATGTPSRAVVVVNYASHRLLEQHLGTLDATGPDVRIVVVDNWSSAVERIALQELATRHAWDLVCLPDNRGFGAAVNAGIAAARKLGCVSFLLLNPDAVIETAVVDALHEHSLREPLAMISPRIVDSTGATVFRGAHLDLATGRVSSRGLVPTPDADAVSSCRPPRRTTPWLTGACVALHADLLDRIGGFDSDYFMYWEDVDLSYRCTRAGGTLVVRDDLVAVHDEGGTQGERRGRAKSALYYRYNCRNRLLFAARNLNRADTTRWMAGSLGAGYQILLQGGRRQFLHSPHLLVMALVGTLHGLGLAARGLLRSRRRTEGGHTVLIVHPSAQLYGSDRVLIESVEALTASGAEVEVVLPETGPLEEMLKARGVSVVHCPMPVLRKEGLRPSGFVRLVKSVAVSLMPSVRLLTGRPIQQLYVNTLTIPSWLFLGRLLGLRVVCHVHEAERSVPALVRLLLAAPLTLAHRVVVNSHFSLDVLADSLPRIRRRATVVYNAVPGPVESSPARRVLDGPLHLLYVGRLSARKGPQVAVAAAAILRDRGVDVRLHLLGSVYPGYEWFERELRAQVTDSDLADRVEFLGFRSDVWPFVQQADIVLVPSVADEPFGNTAVEAALAARPLVVSDGSGLREATAGMSAVFRVDPARPDHWADAIQRIMGTWPEQVSRAERDASSAAQRFSRQRYQNELAAIVLPARGA